MADNIVLTGGVRSNLLALQGIADMMNTTQTRLASGKKVNTPLDSAVNFFTSAGLQSRSSDLAALLDAMSNSIQTVNAANHGITAIVTTVQSMQSTLMQARQDATWQSTSYTYDAARVAVAGDDLSFVNGSVGAIPVSISINGSNKTSAFAGPVLVGDDGEQFTISNGTTTTGNITLNTGDTVDTIVGTINVATAAAGLAITASNVGGFVRLTNTFNDVITIAEGGVPGGAALMNFGATAITAKTLDDVVAAVNNTVLLQGKVKASNDAGTLRIQNLSTIALDVTGVTSGAVDGLAGTTSISGNTVRRTLVTQFNQLRDQLDKFSADASFNGINLLQGDVLKVIFNEQSTSTLDIVAKDVNGNPFVVNSINLGIDILVNTDLDSNSNIDLILNSLTQALQMARTQASGFGSSLSIVQNRQDFTKQMISTLKTGADNLVVADTNEEGANMLALQTRQQLSIAALSLANQANQSVLRLFG